MARSAWWMTLVLVPLLAAAALGFHDPFHRDETGPDMSVTHGLVFQDFRIQFNLSVENHQDDAENVALTLELPDLGPFPDPEGDGGWSIVEDADGACFFVGDERFRCAWDEFPSHMARSVKIVGDASCLCGTFDMLFQVTADGEVDERDNSQVIRLDWPCATPAGSMGTSVEPSVDDGAAQIAIAVRNEAFWPPLFGVEVWSDLPIVPGGWKVVDKDTSETGPSSCFVHLNEDIVCDVSPVWGMGELRVILEAASAEACGTHPFQVVVTSDGNAPRHIDRLLEFAPCEADGVASVSAATSAVGEAGRGTFVVRVANTGDVPAANVRLSALFPDLARPWSFDDLDREHCVVEDRALVECLLPLLGARETRTFTGWTTLDGWCGDDVRNTVFLTADNAGPGSHVSDSLDVDECGDGRTSDAAITGFPENGRDWVIITWNVTAVGDAASEDVEFRTTLPHMGGARWIVHGEDREYCALTFNDLHCDFGTIPAGVTRQVWTKAWQHHDDCGFDVVSAHLTAEDDAKTGGNNQAEATIVPPWKLHQERTSHQG